jgi:phenylpropionate dioxygenase-like ring-hydroxylating dioxygenase large terminal subunit
VPKSFQVPAFLCREQDSYIWIWIGEPDFAPTQPPGIANFQQYHWYQGSVPMQCESIKAIENNLDWCHPYFTHPWTHGQFFATHYRGFKEQSYEMRIHASGLVVFAPATESESDPIPESPPIRIDFELPDRVRVEFAKPCHRIILMHFVPTGAFTCRLEWLVTKILPFGSHTAWSDQEPVIFKQDRLILESARSWYELEGDSFECSVEADACTLLARKIVDLAAHNRWETLRSSLPQRRVVRVRA